jgi:hypothetical protein
MTIEDDDGDKFMCENCERAFDSRLDLDLDNFCKECAEEAYWARELWESERR